MATRGRWGITRDEAGQLAYITEWPWYWRYPLGVATIALTAWFAIYAEGRSEVVMWGGIITGSLLTLCMMYELGCLSIVIAVVYGAWKLLDIFLPDVHVPQWVIFSAITWYLLYMWGKHEREKKADLDRVIENIWSRMNRIEESMNSLKGNSYVETSMSEIRTDRMMSDLERRIARLERESDDPFGNFQ